MAFQRLNLRKLFILQCINSILKSKTDCLKCHFDFLERHWRFNLNFDFSYDLKNCNTYAKTQFSIYNMVLFVLRQRRGGGNGRRDDRNADFYILYVAPYYSSSIITILTRCSSH